MIRPSCTETQLNLNTPVGARTDANGQADENLNQAATQIKICGLMRADDVAAVNQAKPDFAGFIFAASRRQLTLTAAADLSARLAPSIQAVGVFSDQSLDEILQAVLEAKLAVVQLHGHEDDSYRSRLRRILDTYHASDTAIWQMVAMSKSARKPDEFSVMTTQDRDSGTVSALTGQTGNPYRPAAMTARIQPDRWLLDHVSLGQRGGTGQTFDWSAAVDLCRRYPVMLAGGLHQDNVAAAIHLLHPLGVDCSSGVETAGKKDPVKILRFCEAVRATDAAYARNLSRQPTLADRADGLIGNMNRSTGGQS